MFEFSVGQTSKVRGHRTKCTAEHEASFHVLLFSISGVCMRLMEVKGVLFNFVLIYNF